MSNGPHSNDDRDLLSRLLALKKSPIELDDTKPVLAAHLAADEALNANPAHALLSDLTTRFQGLKGAHTRGYTYEALKKDGTPLNIPELQNENNDKTVEELLAELGPDDHWTLGENEDNEITALLKTAHGALEKKSAPGNGEGTEPPLVANVADTLDVSSFQPEPDSAPSSPDTKDVPIDDEAELTLQRLLDEIALDPTPTTLISQADGDHEAGLEFPVVPREPAPDPPPPYAESSKFKDSGSVDDALAARFASLSLPNPSQDDSDENGGLNLPSVPVGIIAPSTSTIAPPDNEIDSWCIICLDDANLKCLGCDGELYCTKCWLEGHSGEDAGYEERRHKAVQYVKGSEAKKRRLVGA